MKKLLLSLLVIFSIALAGCEPAETEVLGCAPGFERVEGVCTEVEDPNVVCDVNEEVIDGECVEKTPSNIDLSGPVYTSQNYSTYESRDLVSSSCEHLDNIGEWQPVWCDEFDYTGLPKSTLWKYDVGGNGWGNGESQYYTNADLDNAFVKDGVLTIKAIKENLSGNDYTSTRLISKNTGDFLYGKIQIRAKVPTGRGVWPAIWMLPTDWEYGSWPHSGEIDIMEYVGYQPNVLHATIHTGAFNHSLNTQVGKAITVNTIEEEFHVFEIEWEPNVIRYYLDGVPFFTVGYDPDDSYRVEPFEAWPFDKDFHLLINTAVGGAWGGAQGIDDSIFPQSFLIDYVRVYQKDYVGMDNENPSPVLNGRVVNVSTNEAFIAWDKASDDVMTKEYEVYFNGSLIDTVTHNGYHIKGLSSETTYSFGIIPVDFAGNKGTETTIQVVTDSPLSVNDRIEAEDYETMSGIQMENTSDAGGGENIGWLDTGDYTTYTVVVDVAGNYTITSRVASQDGGASFNILNAANDVLASQTVNGTGGWQNWQSVTSNTFYLNQGTFTFKMEVTSSGFNLNYFEFTKVD